MRAVALYAPILLLAAAWLARRPGSRERTAALLASLWNLPALLALHVLATTLGWWHFEAEGGLLAGLPIDLYLGWTILWGALPALAMSRLALPVLIAVAVLFDAVAMPGAQPVVRLGSTWLLGEAVGIALCLVPAQLLARWTARDTHLAPRAVLQVVCFGGLLVGVLPTVVLTASQSEVPDLRLWSTWQLSLAMQILALPAILGLSAVQEFVQRGAGTPVPFDPPRRLVISGPYAYLANPMQASAWLVMLGLAVLLMQPLLAVAALVDIAYGLGLAGWHERRQMVERFGSAWLDYRSTVRNWWPRWRPYQTPGREPDELFVASTCDACSSLARWLVRRRPVGVRLVAAEDYPSGDLERLTYRPADGSPIEQGVVALGRALEHINLAWALVGWTVRLPLVRELVQLLVDASGGGPRRVPRVPYTAPRTWE